MYTYSTETGNNRYVQYALIPGKSGPDGTCLPLWIHLEDTANVMDFLCAQRVPNSVINACGLENGEFRKVCIFLAMAHDIGKCTPLFVAGILRSIPSYHTVLSGSGIDVPDISAFLYRSKSKHARAGEALLEKYGCPNGICSVVGAHHGVPTAANDIVENQLEDYPENYYAGQKDIWEGMQEIAFRNALERSGYSDVSELPVLSNCAQMLLTGLLIEADWIASNQAYFPLLTEDILYTYDDCRARAKRALAELSFPALKCFSPVLHDAEHFYAERFGFIPNAMQRLTAEIAASNDTPGLMIVEAQMGTGKTEAALAAAEIMSAKAGCGGIFFGLPTQATSNGIFPRLASWAERISDDGTHAIRLVHGMAELNEDYRAFANGSSSTDDDNENGVSRLTVHSWFAGRKQALLADFIVGTVDTALMAALTQKHVMLRHLGLCGKTVVIDECHAYDSYMSRFLDRMLTWLGAYRVPVVLLSATLPRKRKQDMLRAYTQNKKLCVPEIAGYPLITWTEGSEAHAKTVELTEPPRCVQMRRLDEAVLAAELEERLRDGGCAGVIVNTVRRAQEISESLRRLLPDKKVYVYHAQFIAEDRIKREKELIDMIGKHSAPAERDNVIIVGTQVLEQSLDIDFDYLVTDLCPMDLLLQRIGRLHRHSRMRPEAMRLPVCSVLCTEGEANGEYESGAERIYGRWLLLQTMRYLPAEIRLPADIPGLVDAVYAEPEETSPEWEKFKLRTDIKEGKAGGWLLPKPKMSKRRPELNSIAGMLDDCIESDRKAEASVRDGMRSVDVLVMRRTDESHIGYMPCISEDVVRADTVPSDEEGRRIAMQRLRLPFALCCGERLENVIDTLESENTKLLSVWQQSPWIKGELVLLLDAGAERELCGFRLRYEPGAGLIYERNGD